MLRISIGLMFAAALLGGAFGCSEALETGYKPRALKDSGTVRRSYYASPFSADAKAPSMEREQEFDARRPKPGY